MTFHLSIITPEKTIFDNEVSEATIPTIGGEVTILPNHVPVFTQLQGGEIILNINGKTEHFAVEGGFLDVSQKSTTILADFAVHGKDISVAAAEEAKRRAEEKLKQNLSAEEIAEIEGELRRSLLQIKIAQKYKR